MTTTGSSPETVRPTDELVDAVVRLMPDAAVVVDGAGRIVAANALAERQFGYSPEALIGTAIESLVPDR
ncbi:MAG: PAS domain-containing protein, partial [Acidimicrobiales bacterium]